MTSTALTLLFAQQAGAMHALSHTLAEQRQDQQDKQSSHNPAACGQCAAYTQLSSALNGTVCLLLEIPVTAATACGGSLMLISVTPC